MATTSEELIDSGFAVEKDTDTLTAVINIDIKKAAVAAGLLEDFASLYGWESTILNEENEEIDNPVKCYVKCRDIIVNFVNDVASLIISNRINAAADIQKAQIKAAFGINN